MFVHGIQERFCFKIAHRRIIECNDVLLVYTLHVLGKNVNMFTAEITRQVAVMNPGRRDFHIKLTRVTVRNFEGNSTPKWYHKPVLWAWLTLSPRGNNSL